MPGKGFLIRGNLRPSNIGTSSKLGQSMTAGAMRIPRPPKPPNRIPPSISAKRGPGR